jgi:predicted DNA-binding transcriptional regulator YafY
MSERTPDGHSTPPDLKVTATLVTGCANRRRLRLAYRLGPAKVREMDVDPWAVVVRFGKWYLLGWSHTAGARRILRMDRVTAVEDLPETFEAPTDLDPVAAIEEHLSEGWTHKIEVVVDAPIADVKCWVPRKLARLEPVDDRTTRLVGSTNELDWYAERLAGIPRPFRVVQPAALREQVAVVGRRMLANAGAPADESRAGAGSGPA